MLVCLSRASNPDALLPGIGHPGLRVRQPVEHRLAEGKHLGLILAAEALEVRCLVVAASVVPEVIPAAVSYHPRHDEAVLAHGGVIGLIDHGLQHPERALEPPAAGFHAVLGGVQARGSRPELDGPLAMLTDRLAYLHDGFLGVALEDGGAARDPVDELADRRDRELVLHALHRALDRLVAMGVRVIGHQHLGVPLGVEAPGESLG
eukprot:10234739-Alexandrium_andersonii.AAC.1